MTGRQGVQSLGRPSNVSHLSDIMCIWSIYPHWCIHLVFCSNLSFEGSTILIRNLKLSLLAREAPAPIQQKRELLT
jgi:hypothetical protein